ncbi:sulfite exporter TauE/SafE family protein [Paraferrimonas sedimenticola]|uniref:Cytochrome biogenesis protein n=1 Tax=Paraferrimonas sedimenticola TaxID=375674 RepID=A0AA37RVP2_9GAMM|nr:sulfite exporter TauE/SafE family protein [Paraferrimonas sedimenticola]GLP96091.1 cytochrome biogenesis protein [Paraferrimonas sedimenticola]
MTEITPWAALLVGLMGGGHCLGMCGGLMAAMSLSASSNSSKKSLILGYNLGRITSYMIAGAIVGGVVASIAQVTDASNGLLWLRFVAAALMIVTGLYIAGINQWLTVTEKAGKQLWAQIQPLAKRLLPVANPLQAYMAGIVWGWLPCGLVYSMLTWAIASGSAAQGATLMAAFGLGTLPALLLVGVAAKKLEHWLKHKGVRLVSGLLLIAYGVQTFVIGLQQLS